VAIARSCAVNKTAAAVIRTRLKRKAAGPRRSSAVLMVALHD
jgi:hypothetical protein